MSCSRCGREEMESRTSGLCARCEGLPVTLPTGVEVSTGNILFATPKVDLLAAARERLQEAERALQLMVTPDMRTTGLPSPFHAIANYLVALADYRAAGGVDWSTKVPPPRPHQVHSCDIPGCASCGNPEEPYRREPDEGDELE